MKHLEFKRKYLDLLLSGKKRSTIRKRVYVKPGDEVYIHCGGMIIGKAKIISIREININEVDDEIARMEGLNSKDELLNELSDYYQDSDLFLIEFDFRKFESPITPHEMHYGNKNILEIAKKALESQELTEGEKKIIELFLKTKSIRRTAFILGGMSKRGIVRNAIRKAIRVVKEHEIDNGLNKIKKL